MIGLRVYLYSLSRVTYAFKQSENQYEGTYGDYFVQPVGLYSNFSHGVGVLGLYQVDSATVYF
mgnify:CR=1 FL=1